MTAESGKQQPVDVALANGSTIRFTPGGQARMIGADGQPVAGSHIRELLQRPQPQPHHESSEESVVQRQARKTAELARVRGGTSVYELHGVGPDSPTANSDTK